MLYILKALRHLLSHLIPVISVKKPGSAVIPALHTGEDPEAQRPWGTQGHTAAKCLLHLFKLVQAPRILGFHNFWVVSSDVMSR